MAKPTTLVGMTTEQIVDLGIALVPEGRRLFPRQTVEENLLLGASRRNAREQIKTNWISAARCSRGWPSVKDSSPAR